MDNSAFELGEHLQLREIKYKASNLLWKKWDIKDLDLKFSKWNKIKYLDNDNQNLNTDLQQIPNNKGGLYLFYLNCNTIMGITEMPIYIGRAQLTPGQNLRKRIREYYQKYSKSNERPKITRMLNYWSEDLYVAYYVLDNNEDIIEIEKKIINSLLLPMNDEIPEKEIRQAVKAF